MHRKINELIMVLREDERILSLGRICGDSGVKCWLVGGFIRDCLLGRLPVDMDFVTSEGAEEVSRNYAKKNRGKFITLGKEPKISYRIAARGEIIDVVGALEKNLKTDLSKRDFTINAVALDINSWQVYDPFGGVEDICNGILRQVSSESFVNDPLRVVRGIRYASTVDDLSIEEDTYIQMKVQSQNIINCAFERFNEEVNKMFKSFNPERGLKLIIETELIDHIIKVLMSGKILKEVSLEKKEEMKSRFISNQWREILSSLKKNEYKDVLNTSGLQKTLWISALMFLYMNITGISSVRLKELLVFMRFSGKDVKRIYAVLCGVRDIFEMASRKCENDELKIYMGRKGSDFVIMQALYEGFSQTGGTEDGKQSKIFCGRMAKLFSDNREALLFSAQIITGDDVKKIIALKDGGREIGVILDKVRDMQFAGKISSREDALEYVRNYKIS